MRARTRTEDQTSSSGCWSQIKNQPKTGHPALSTLRTKDISKPSIITNETLMLWLPTKSKSITSADASRNAKDNNACVSSPRIKCASKVHAAQHAFKLKTTFCVLTPNMSPPAVLHHTRIKTVPDCIIK